MKLSIISDEISQDVGEAISTASEFALAGLEIRSAWNRQPLNFTVADCRRIGAMARAAGLAIAGFASPVLKCLVPTSSNMARAVADLHASAELALALGSPSLRVFPFYRADGPPDPARVGPVMRRLLEPLSDTGLTVLVENGTRSHAPTSVELAVIMEHLTGLNCGALWDPGNAEFSGGSVGSVENNYDVIRPWLHHVHVKDPYYQSHYVKVGQGTVPWKRILNILNEERFAGWISLETHWRPDAALPRRLLDSPHGEEFSAGGVEASRQCLRVVIEMIQGENP